MKNGEVKKPDGLYRYHDDHQILLLVMTSLPLGMTLFAADLTATTRLGHGISPLGYWHYQQPELQASQVA